MCVPRFIELPSDPTVVVLGENTTKVSLSWNYDLEGKTLGLIKFVQIKEVKGKEVKTEILSYKSDETGLKINDNSPLGYRATLIMKDANDVNVLKNKATLEIKSVEKKDEAKYRCLVVTKNFDTFLNEVQLRVLGKCSWFTRFKTYVFACLVTTCFRPLDYYMYSSMFG